MSEVTRRRRVLFVHDDNPRDPLSSFLVHDLLALRKHFEVEELSLYAYGRAHLNVLMSPAAWGAVARCDLVFVWFGTNAALVVLATILRKPAIVIAGGSDVVYVPEIDYGLNPAKKRTYKLVLLGYRLARRVLLFSHASRRDFLRLPGINADKAETLHLGVDTQHFHPGPPKRGHVLSISYITRSSIRRKGVLTLLEAAKRTPEIEYRVAGLVVDPSAVQDILSAAPTNVRFLGQLDDTELLAELQAAKIYAQLSYHEGFGMAVAEAMACGCIPVVTDRGSLPEVVGGAGLYVPVEDPAATAAAIRTALDAGEELGQAARQRAVELFDPSVRERALARVVEEIASA